MATTSNPVMETSNMKDVTPPVLQGPTSREKRYDRQLRLWAANGQAALEEAHVLLVSSGCGVVGVETVKNLVLPGIGRFTILDTETVDESDLGVNFFLDENALGKSRAEHCCKLLQELNPDAHGHHISESLDSCLADAGFLRPYTAVILTGPASSHVLQRLSQTAQDQQIPFFYVHSLGFYSHFSVSLPAAFPVVETHPDPVTVADLRILNPWPELQALEDEVTGSLEDLSDYDHGHVPYVLLLLHFLGAWKDDHDGETPRDYKEKCEFRQTVLDAARTDNPEGGEENFDEAGGAVLKALNPYSVSSNVKEVFEAQECLELTKESAGFWIIASAIASFYKDHGCLPLPGSLPDMKARSADYIRLQNVYRSKAQRDCSDVLERVRKTEQRLGRGNAAVDEKEVELFCKGAGFVKLVRGRPLHMTTYQKGETWGDRASYACQEMQTFESLLPLYVAFLAHTMILNEDVQSAAEEASDTAQVEDAVLDRAQTILRDLWKENGKDFEIEVDDLDEVKQILTCTAQIVKEMIRADGNEIHNISALTGGILAQEIIKVITKQYIPVDNTYLFDGVGSRMAVFHL